MSDLVQLSVTYAGWAPGTEFRVVRRHRARLLTLSPTEHPFRAITVPVSLVQCA